jgi:hypothetical protein
MSTTKKLRLARVAWPLSGGRALPGNRAPASSVVRRPRFHTHFEHHAGRRSPRSSPNVACGAHKRSSRNRKGRIAGLRIAGASTFDAAQALSAFESNLRLFTEHRDALLSTKSTWKAILLVRVVDILTSIDFATSCCGFVPRSRRFQRCQEPSSHAKRFPSGNEWR